MGTPQKTHLQFLPYLILAYINPEYLLLTDNKRSTHFDD